MEINAKVFQANAKCLVELGEDLRRFEISAWRPMARLVAVVITVERATSPTEVGDHGALEDRVVRRWLAGFAGFESDPQPTGIAVVLAAALVADQTKTLKDWQMEVAAKPPPRGARILVRVGERVWSAVRDLEEPPGQPDFEDVAGKLRRMAAEMGDQQPLLNVNGDSKLAVQAQLCPQRLHIN